MVDRLHPQHVIMDQHRQQVLSRPDLCLEILRQLAVADRAAVCATGPVFASASRDVPLWRDAVPSWWQEALALELDDSDVKGWRTAAVVLHTRFPAALTVEPLENGVEHGGADGAAASSQDRRWTNRSERVWRMAAVRPSAVWHDLLLTKALHAAKDLPAGDLPRG